MTFPADYKEFVRRFGGGTIEGQIAILIPSSTAEREGESPNLDLS
ncbi:hypothetical protein [Streptomyces sp. NBC_00102]